jgi:hypothetical protein
VDAGARPLLCLSVTMSELRSLFSLLTLYPFYEGFMGLLGPRELHALSFTSKTMSLIVEPFLRRAQDVNGQLQEFVDDARSFRCELRETDAVLFGDFAFRFFAGVRRECRTLDVLLCYTIGGEFLHLRDLISYLVRTEGYMRPVMRQAMFVSEGDIHGVWVSR